MKFCEDSLTHDGRECFTHTSQYVEESGLDYHWYEVAPNGSEVPIY